MPSVGDERVQIGFADFGGFVKNPRSAASARPDSSGTALLLYQAYILDAVNGDKVGFLSDLVFLTDRESARSYQPVSLDYLLGMSTRFDSWRVQFDRDEAMSLKGGSGGWRNWSVRGSYLLQSKKEQLNMPKFGRRRRFDVGADAWSLGLTAGYFLHPGTTPSRLDGTGQVEWRYQAAGRMSFMKETLLLQADADMLTDRNTRRRLPSDLDLDLGIGTKIDQTELMIHRRSRQAIGAPGYALYYLLTARIRFDSRTMSP